MNLAENPQYPYSFEPGTFMYDYFGISGVDLSSLTDAFVGADGHFSYPRLDVDSAKVPIPGWNGTMRWIEAFSVVPPAETIFTMDMENDTSTFEEAVCGIRNLTDSVKTVFFGFPLYYMDSVQARQVVQKVMDDFEEPVLIEEKKISENTQLIRLIENYPNLFSQKISINYHIGRNTRVSVKVFNIAGQLVSVLYDDWKKPGVYIDIWNGRTSTNSEAANGIYFIRLQSGDESIMRKIVKIR